MKISIGQAKSEKASAKCRFEPVTFDYEYCLGFYINVQKS